MATPHQPPAPLKPTLRNLRVLLSILLLFLNYFLAQFDKFLYSYFQPSLLSDLSLTPTQYGLLNGYATSIAYALLALPIAFISDYTRSRVWILTLCSLWWSACFALQSLANNFWQLLLGRLAMGLGQAAVEALSVSLISDLVRRRERVWVAEGALYVGVYVGEAVNAQISTAFRNNGLSWRIALRGVGVAGVLVGVAIRVVLREPERRASLLQDGYGGDGFGEAKGDAKTDEDSRVDGIPPQSTHDPPKSRFSTATQQLRLALHHAVSMHSFLLLTLAASLRQLSGNVFGYYMPSYLSSTYPSIPSLLSNYGIIVGTVGSSSVLLGGLLGAYFLRGRREWVTFPLWLTGVGGMVSSGFVLLMVFAKQLRGGDEDSGAKVLYAVMALAYLTAELWLGAFAALLVLLFPPRLKTFLLTIYQAVIILVYSSGPEIVGLALKGLDPSSDGYLQRTKVVLAVIIPAGYWLAGVLFLLAVGKVRRDVKETRVLEGGVESRPTTRGRKMMYLGSLGLLGVIVIVLFVLSLVYGI